MKHAIGWMGVAAAVWLALGVAAAWADYSEVVEGVTWSYSRLLEKAWVTGADPATGELSVPSSLGNCPVTCIEGHAFSGCIDLTSVTIPDSVTIIGYEAFSGCIGLTNVTLGNGVTSIRDRAFSGCIGLLGFHVASGNPSYATSDGVLLSKDGQEIVRFPAGKTGDYAIPDSVASIGYYAFQDCIGLTSVTIPDSVTSIGYEAFQDCISLTSVTIPDNVTNIGWYAFCDCSGLTSVKIADSVRSIGGGAFSGCPDALYDGTSIPGVRLVDGWVVGFTDSLPPVLDLSGIRGIASWAFSGCNGLTSVTLGNGVANINWQSFVGCIGLTNISVAAGNPQYSSANGLLLNKDGTMVLVGVSGAVTIPHGVTSIGEYAFSGRSGLTSVTIPDSVTSIELYAFTSCTGLTSVTIPDSVTSLGQGAFDSCIGLSGVTLGNGVTNLELDVFRFCRGLTSVTIPDSVTRIHTWAFCHCSGLASVTIGNGVTSIEGDAFYDCNGLKVLYVPTGWDAKTMLSYAAVPHGCAIVAYDATGEAKTTETPVAVPQVWLAKEAGGILAGTEGCRDFEAAAKAEASNRMPVWECYLAGLSPTDPAAEFKVKSFSVKEGGEVVVEWEPDLRGTEEERSYVVEGAKTLGGAWGEPDAASRFFRVRVGMP